MKKVLITGANGLIGTACLPLLLDQGYKIHAVSGKHSGKDDKGITWEKCDLLEVSGIQKLVTSVKPDYLLHLAWYTEHQKFFGSTENFRWLISSLELFRQFYAGGGKKAVGAGTCAEYSWQDGSILQENSTPLKPQTLYGRIKGLLHEGLNEIAGTYKAEYAWGRIFFLYGPGENNQRLVPAAIAAMAQGRPFTCSQSHKLRDYLHVSDVAAAFAALLAGKATGAVNIGSGAGTKLAEITEILGKLMHRMDLVDNREETVSDVLAIIAATEKIRTETDWRPKVGLAEGLQELIGTFKP